MIATNTGKTLRVEQRTLRNIPDFLAENLNDSSFDILDPQHITRFTDLFQAANDPDANGSLVGHVQALQSFMAPLTEQYNMEAPALARAFFQASDLSISDQTFRTIAKVEAAKKSWHLPQTTMFSEIALCQSGRSFILKTGHYPEPGDGLILDGDLANGVLTWQDAADFVAPDTLMEFFVRENIFVYSEQRQKIILPQEIIEKICWDYQQHHFKRLTCHDTAPLTTNINLGQDNVLNGQSLKNMVKRGYNAGLWEQKTLATFQDALGIPSHKTLTLEDLVVSLWAEKKAALSDAKYFTHGAAGLLKLTKQSIPVILHDGKYNIPFGLTPNELLDYALIPKDGTPIDYDALEEASPQLAELVRSLPWTESEYRNFIDNKRYFSPETSQDVQYPFLFPNGLPRTHPAYVPLEKRPMAERNAFSRQLLCETGRDFITLNKRYPVEKDGPILQSGLCNQGLKWQDAAHFVAPQTLAEFFTENKVSIRLTEGRKATLLQNQIEQICWDYYINHSKRLASNDTKHFSPSTTVDGIEPNRTFSGRSLEHAIRKSYKNGSTPYKTLKHFQNGIGIPLNHSGKIITLEDIVISYWAEKKASPTNKTPSVRSGKFTQGLVGIFGLSAADIDRGFRKGYYDLRLGLKISELLDHALIPKGKKPIDYDALETTSPKLAELVRSLPWTNQEYLNFVDNRRYFSPETSTEIQHPFLFPNGLPKTHPAYVASPPSLSVVSSEEFVDHSREVPSSTQQAFSYGELEVA